MKICYVQKKFRPETLRIIGIADQICEEYKAQNLNLTLRQLYYQFVARDIIPNNMKAYKGLQKVVNDARLAGYIHWDAIIDRTRNLQTHASWSCPDSIIRSCATSYRRDPWENQEFSVQVWVEKDALLGVVERAAERYRLPYFSCRGYVSQSEIWQAAMKLQSNSPVIILHLGDHDPSGVDMTRDMQDRFNLFGAGNVTFCRIALVMEQVRALNPPPNPAKITDTRAASYIKSFGNESWELDALPPTYLVDLIHTAAERYIDFAQWNKDLAVEYEDRSVLREISDNYTEVVKFLKDEQ